METTRRRATPYDVLVRCVVVCAVVAFWELVTTPPDSKTDPTLGLYLSALGLVAGAYRIGDRFSKGSSAFIFGFASVLLFVHRFHTGLSAGHWRNLAPFVTLFVFVFSGLFLGFACWMASAMTSDNLDQPDSSRVPIDPIPHGSSADRTLTENSHE